MRSRASLSTPVSTRGAARALLGPDRLGRLGRRTLLGLGERALEPGLEVLEELLGLLDRDVATADQPLGVDLADRPARVDDLVHLRLGERRVVGLVVAVPPVADEVDDDVAVEPLPVGEREPTDPDHGLGVVAVDVQDRRVDGLGDVGGVVRRPGRVRRGREADLVVDHDVDGAAGAVATQLRQVERLGHHALAGERRVAVHQQRQDREHALVPAVVAVLHRAGDALDDRVDGLEVRRVRRQVQVEGVARPGLVHAGRAEVVLDVAGALDGVGVDVPLELAEDLLVVLAEDVRQDVEPPAVGHAHDDVGDVVVGGGLADRVEQRDQRLAALDAEPLLPHVLGVQEALERLGRVEAAQDPQLVVGRDVLGDTLDLLADPALLVGVEHVPVLDADRAAVRVAQHPEDVAQGHPLAVPADVGDELAVEVPDRQPVVGGVELGVHRRLRHPQRVEVGDEVAAHPVHVRELVDLHLLGEQVGLVVDVGRVRPPARRLVGQPERREDLVVEAVLAEQQLVHALEVEPGLGPLDHPVVVGRGERDDLGDAELRDRARSAAW
jgi:hypothetical protein